MGEESKHPLLVGWGVRSCGGRGALTQGQIAQRTGTPAALTAPGLPQAARGGPRRHHFAAEATEAQRESASPRSRRCKGAAVGNAATSHTLSWPPRAKPWSEAPGGRLMAELSGGLDVVNPGSCQGYLDVAR